MVIFKSYPRCSGDRILENDLFGWYVICLACGYVSYPDLALDARRPVSISQQQKTA
jgi:hypothetical protein